MIEKVNRVLNLEEAIQQARLSEDDEKLGELCILMALERIEDRLCMIAVLFKQRIKNRTLWMMKT